MAINFPLIKQLIQKYFTVCYTAGELLLTFDHPVFCPIFIHKIVETLYLFPIINIKYQDHKTIILSRHGGCRPTV